MTTALLTTKIAKRRRFQQPNQEIGSRWSRALNAKQPSCRKRNAAAILSMTVDLLHSESDSDSPVDPNVLIHGFTPTRSVSEGTMSIDPRLRVGLSRLPDHYMNLAGAVNARGQLQLNVARLAGAGNQRDIGRQSVSRAFDPQFLEQVEQIGHNLRRLADRDMPGRQQADRPALTTRTGADHQ